MRVEVQIDGHKKVLDTTKAIDRELVKGIKAALRTSAADMRREARAQAPKFTGNLRFRMWPGLLSATVYIKAPHKFLVAFGRKPGRIPPTAALKEWVKYKGLPDSMAFVIARSIARKGTRASVAFMDMAWNAMRPAAVQRIRDAVEKVFQTEGRG